MIKRELAKDPQLSTESWDRFLPKFRTQRLSTSQKTAKKNEKFYEKDEARKAAGLPSLSVASKEKPAKKVYTPFPPAQLPRKVSLSYELVVMVFYLCAQVDMQLESGEYFLKATDQKAKDARRQKDKVNYVRSILGVRS